MHLPSPEPELQSYNLCGSPSVSEECFCFLCRLPYAPSLGRAQPRPCKSCSRGDIQPVGAQQFVNLDDGGLVVATALVVPFRCAGLFGALLAFPLPRTVDKYAQIVLESVSKIPAVYFMYVKHGNESKNLKIAGMNAFQYRALGSSFLLLPCVLRPVRWESREENLRGAIRKG